MWVPVCPHLSQLVLSTSLHTHQLSPAPAWLTAASSSTHAHGSLPLALPVPTSCVCAQLSQKSLTYHSEWFCFFSGIRTLSSWFCLLFHHPFLHQRVKVSSQSFVPVSYVSSSFFLPVFITSCGPLSDRPVTKLKFFVNMVLKATFLETICPFIYHSFTWTKIISKCSLYARHPHRSWKWNEKEDSHNFSLRVYRVLGELNEIGINDDTCWERKKEEDELEHNERAEEREARSG